MWRQQELPLNLDNGKATDTKTEIRRPFSDGTVLRRKDLICRSVEPGILLLTWGISARCGMGAALSRSGTEAGASSREGMNAACLGPLMPIERNSVGRLAR